MSICLLSYNNITVMLTADDVTLGTSDVDIQLLEAAKAGDLELIKVGFLAYQVLQLPCTYTVRQ